GDHKRCSDGERQVRQASRLDRLNQGPPVGLEDHQRQRAKSDYELERPAKADPSKTVSFLRRYHCCLLLASGLGLNVDPDSGEFLESRGNVTWPDGRPPGGSWIVSNPNLDDAKSEVSRFGQDLGVHEEFLRLDGDLFKHFATKKLERT